jgi:hypothetical protein
MCATDDGVALLDERTGRYWQLNRSGALILDALLDANTHDQIADLLCGRYQVTRDHAATDVETLVTQLAATSLVIW